MDIFGGYFTDVTLREIFVTPKVFALWSEHGVTTRALDNHAMQFFYPKAIDVMQFDLLELSPNGRWILLYNPTIKRTVIADIRENKIYWHKNYSEQREDPFISLLGNEYFLEINSVYRKIRLFSLLKGFGSPISEIPLTQLNVDPDAAQWSVHFDAQRRIIYLASRGLSDGPTIQRYTILGERLRNGTAINLIMQNEDSSKNYLHEIFQTRFDVNGFAHVASGFAHYHREMMSSIRTYSLDKGELVAELTFPGMHIEKFAVSPDGKRIAVYARIWESSVFFIWQLTGRGTFMYELYRTESPFRLPETPEDNSLQTIDYIEWKSPTEVIFKDDHFQNIHSIDTRSLD